MPPKKPETNVRRRMISTQLVRFDTPGLTYTGVLITKEQQTLNGNVVGRYVLKNEEATLVINGTVQLDEAMANADEGVVIEILYVGETTTGAGWKVKNFEVYILEVEQEDA